MVKPSRGSSGAVFPGLIYCSTVMLAVKLSLFQLQPIEMAASYIR